MQRYNSVAISLHWLIAFFLIGLLAVGKYMTGLEEADPWRYTLTQWHKSFGIAVLVVALLRILWRIGHRPPALPSSTTAFERLASHLAHLAMYVLMVVIPVSGWVMVSASPLNLKTELFGLIPWPHIGFVADMASREAVADRSVDVHMWLGNTMLALVLLHVAAALLHQFKKKDNLISRMVISSEHRRRNDLSHGLVVGVCLAFAVGGFLFNVSSQSKSLQAVSVAESLAVGQDAGQEQKASDATIGLSSVKFTATQMGEPLEGRFETANVQLSLHVDQLDKSTLSATVLTESVKTSDSQVDATVVTEEWFASEEYPDATFESASFELINAASYLVAGDLTIKGVSKRIEFELNLKDGIGYGAFEINRSDFGVGDEGQDEFVGKEVAISFEAANLAAE